MKGRWAERPGTSTKHKRPHRVFVSTLALEVMGNAGKGPVIKRYEGATIAVYTLSCWLRREKYLGLPSWTPHDLRRTCATHLAANETPPHVVQRILNHADRGITAQVYNQYSYAKEIEVALEMLAGKIREGLPADPAQGVVVLAEYKEEKMVQNPAKAARGGP